MVSLLLVSSMQIVLRNINLRFLVLIIKIPMLRMTSRQSCTWCETSCYMVHFIGMNMALMIWHYGHLLSNMLPGCTIQYLAEQHDLLQLNCLPRLVLIIEIFSELMSRDALSLWWNLSFKMVRKFQNGIEVLRWISSLVSWMTNHFWWQLPGIWQPVMLVHDSMLSFSNHFCSGDNDMVIDAICYHLYGSNLDVYSEEI